MLYISISWDICDPELIHQPYWDTTEREEIAEAENEGAENQEIGLTHIVLESGKNSVSIYWREQSKTFKGYLQAKLKKKHNGDFVYPVVCHRSRPKKNSKHASIQCPCKYRFK